MTACGISIVIPAYNEAAFLPATLASVNEAIHFFSSSTGCPAEAIVVNNASTDLTEAVASNLGAVVVYHEIRNISSVRNAGIRRASYNLIVTIDSDCSLPFDALTRIWILMKDNQFVGAALGVNLITDKIFNRIAAKVIQAVVLRISGIYGAMFCFWKNDALEIGGFPEDRLVAEDSAFAIALRKHGQKHGKKFGRFKSVQVGTLDRKDIRITALPFLIVQVLRAFLGTKQTPEDLKFWYDPKR